MKRPKHLHLHVAKIKAFEHLRFRLDLAKTNIRYLEASQFYWLEEASKSVFKVQLNFTTTLDRKKKTNLHLALESTNGSI